MGTKERDRKNDGTEPLGNGPGVKSDTQRQQYQYEGSLTSMREADISQPAC
jgi:hypothetical protein